MYLATFLGNHKGSQGRRIFLVWPSQWMHWISVSLSPRKLTKMQISGLSLTSRDWRSAPAAVGCLCWDVHKCQHQNCAKEECEALPCEVMVVSRGSCSTVHSIYSRVVCSQDHFTPTSHYFLLDLVLLDITDREARHWNQGWQCLGSLVCLDRTTNFSRSRVQQHN